MSSLALIFSQSLFGILLIEGRPKRGGKPAPPTAIINPSEPQSIPAVRAAGVLLWRHLYIRTSYDRIALMLDVGHSQSIDYDRIV
jgi:hypothetical protein